MDHALICRCGRREANFNFKNEIMPPEVVQALYCPECSNDINHDKSSMLVDNGWVIHYDMEIAGLYKNKLPSSDKERLCPEILFDEGYVTWRGVYPGDHIDSANERIELAKLAKVDPKKYFQEIRTWAIDRMTRLREDGWRKAYEG
jgi:hypothetical protein